MNIKFAIIDGYKNCAKCKKILSIDSFRSNLKIKSGLSSWCKECSLVYMKERYLKKYPPKLKSNIAIPEGFKKCSKCLIIKEAFDTIFCKTPQTRSGLSSDCKECRYKKNKEYRDKNPDKCKEARRKCNHKRRKKRAKYSKKYNKINRARINAYMRHRRAEDPMFRMAANLRGAVKDCIRYKGFRKSSKLAEYLGCNSQEFRSHIESFWQFGMTWNNYGNGPNRWNLDHTLPLASAKTVEELYTLSHYSNIKPMWSSHNSTKRDKTSEEWAIYKLQNNIP